MRQDIRSVVIPAAGRGTRSLPATKTVPKELLTVYDRPVLQFAIDEAVHLDVQRIVVVLHPAKAMIRHYLTPDPAYIVALRDCGKRALADALAKIDVPDQIDIVFVEQLSPLGLGHAVLCAEPAILPGAFAVLLPDDLIFGAPCLSEMAAHYTTGHMIAAQEVSPEDTEKYGIFCLAGRSIGRSVPVSGMVEKPALGQAPSRLGAVGRYILHPRIFDTLRTLPRGAGGEMQLTDAISHDAGQMALTAFQFSGTRYDCGTHDGLLEAALARQFAVKAHLNDSGRGAMTAVCVGGLTRL
jgi:UTP--glucose-1-phosphate uridylyltransferase